MPTNDTIQIPDGTEAVPYADAVSEANHLVGVAEIPDSAALAIASAFQIAPLGYPALAALASGVQVDVDELLVAIHHARQSADTPREHVALDMLATWAMNR